MDYHILSQNLDKKTVQAIFHIPIPIGVNIVGVGWRAALLSWLGGSVESQLLGIPQEELALLQTGELYEKPVTVRFSRLGLTDAAKLDEIKAAYTTEMNAFHQEMAIILDYYGFGGDA